MNNDNKNENRYIGTFTILKEEIDREIIYYRKKYYKVIVLKCDICA